MSTVDLALLLPAIPALKTPPGEEPFLQGLKCRACGEVHVGAFLACPACASRDSLDAVRLEKAGRLYSFSIVHRSYPGVAVPFVSAVVALDGGGHLKGNLVGVAPNPERVRVGARVQVQFREADRRDPQGRGYLTYEFAPAPQENPS